jgi:acyl-CoA thioesterase
MSKTSIDSLFSQVDESKAFAVPESWTQGRTVYGGLSAALLLRALENKVSSEKLLRSLTVAFSAPTLPNVNFEIQTELLREGRTIAQWQARLIQDGTICVQVQAVFGISLESDLQIHSFTAPEIPSVDQAMVYPTKDAPGFTQYFDMAQSQGDLPVSGGNSLELGGWMRIKGINDGSHSLSICHLVATIDVWPPATMMQLEEMKAGSTINWTMQFPQLMPEILGQDYLGYQAEIKYSEGGFGITHAKIWNAKSELLAFSQQTIIIYG